MPALHQGSSRSLHGVDAAVAAPARQASYGSHVHSHTPMQRSHGSQSYATVTGADSSADVTTPNVQEDSRPFETVSEQLRREYGSPGDQLSVLGSQEREHSPSPMLKLRGVAPSGEINHSDFSSPRWPTHSLQALPSPFMPPIEPHPHLSPAPSAQGDLHSIAISGDISSVLQTQTAQHTTANSYPVDVSPARTADSMSPPQPGQSALTSLTGSAMAAGTSCPATSGYSATSASDPFISKPVLQASMVAPAAGYSINQPCSSHHSSVHTPVGTAEMNTIRNSSTATPVSVVTGASSTQLVPSSGDGGEQQIHPRSRSSNTSPGLSPSRLTSTVSSGSFRKVSEARGVTGVHMRGALC
jgi:hypothetical protein